MKEDGEPPSSVYSIEDNNNPARGIICSIRSIHRILSWNKAIQKGFYGSWNTGNPQPGRWLNILVFD